MRRKLKPVMTLAVLGSLLAASEAAAVVIRYVKFGASGTGLGTSWTDAYSGTLGLQNALGDPALAAGGEIWVAFGTYKPTNTADRNATFQLRNNVTIYGGFRGLPGDENVNDATTRPFVFAFDPQNPGDPSDAATHSVLSGDIGTNPGDLDGPNFANYSDNSYHLITGTATNSTAILVGCTIRGGNANGASDQRGGGFYNDGGNPTFSKCAFVNNLAYGGAGGALDIDGANTSYSDCLFQGNSALGGGAVHMNRGSSPTFNNCHFQANKATYTVSYTGGGAVYCRSDNPVPSRPVFTGCTFAGNTAANSGGAVFMDYDAQPRFVDCTFTANSCNVNGGVAFITASNPYFINSRFFGNQSPTGGALVITTGGVGPASPQLANCVFSGNSAINDAGAVFCNDECTPTFANCTFGRHSAARGGVFYVEDTGGGPTVTLNNCIVWNTNFAPIGAEIYLSGGTVNVSYSTVLGGYPGTGNITADPLLVDPDGVDNAYGTSDDDLRLSPASPCIDAGRNSDVPADYLDLDGDTNTTEPTPLDLAFGASPSHTRFLDDTYRCDTGSGSAPVVDMGAYENDGVWANPNVLFVNPGATGGNNGSTWNDAFTDLQPALSAATNFLTGCTLTTPPCPPHPNSMKLWVASGTYKPTSGTDRGSSFQLRNNVALYGGFNGTETLLSQRNPNPNTNGAVLSGNINSPGSDGDNSYHVVNASSVNTTAILNGFTIERGFGDGPSGPEQDRGGGLYCSAGSPTIANCVFRQNRSQLYGAGAHVDSGAARLVNCDFRNNSNLGTTLNGAGGVYCTGSGTTSLTNCVLNGNRGSAVGGLYLFSGTAILTHCTVVSNYPLANTGCAGCNGGLLNTGSLQLKNCILWGNVGKDMAAVGQSAQISGSTPSVTSRCCIQGWNGSLGGVGNIGDDPRLVDFDGLDNSPGTDDDNLRLLSVSPCIDRGGIVAVNDAADAADLDGDADCSEPLPLDLDRRPRRYDFPGAPDVGKGTEPIVDIGAYEFSAGDADICNGGLCPGDLNRDGFVNGLDTQAFVDLLLIGAVCP